MWNTMKEGVYKILCKSSWGELWQVEFENFDSFAEAKKKTESDEYRNITDCVIVKVEFYRSLLQQKKERKNVNRLKNPKAPS